ncbi:MAG: hypothetical protein RR144_01650 [Clostridia bacterium]
MDDMDDSVLNYAQIKAIASGNPLILDKFKIDTEVQQLQDKERNYKATRYRLEDNVLKTIPNSIKYTENIIEKLEYDKSIIKQVEDSENCNITFEGKIFNNYKDAGEEILKLANGYMELNKDYKIGNYRGFDITLTNKGISDFFSNNGEARKIITIQGKYKLEFDLSKIPAINIKKLNEKIDNIEELLVKQKEYVIYLKKQLAECEIQLEKPFEYKEKLQKLLTKQAEINRELHLDKEEKDLSIIEEDEETEEQEEGEIEENEEYLEEDESEYE